MVSSLRRSGFQTGAVALAVSLALVFTGCASSPSTPTAGSTIKIGILTTCGGPFATFEQESFSGAKFALVQNAGGKSQGAGPEDQVSGAAVAGHRLQISFGCCGASPAVAWKGA